MKSLLKNTIIICNAVMIAACSTMADNHLGPSAQMVSAENVSKVTEFTGFGLDDLHARSREANDKIKAYFPKDQNNKITLWAIDMENLVDGTFTQTFGDKTSPAPAVKMHKLVKDSGVTLVDHFHVPPCRGADSEEGQFWVLRTFVTDLDETVNRKVKGFYPNGESGDFQAEIDRGTRSMTDTFKLSAKLTECRSGKIIHSAENTFSKTASGKDNSVYLFGKYLGLFYRSTEYEDPGLNRTKDLALDVFLAGIAMDMVGAPKDFMFIDGHSDNEKMGADQRP